MSADGHRRAAAGIPPKLHDLGVNAGRRQRGGRGSPSGCDEQRVVIDMRADGVFTVYADPDIQVICRCAHLPDDELVEIDPRPIPEDWLEAPIGHRGDGSVADLLAEVVTEWPNGGPI